MEREQTKITALVITYNEIGYIENCLKSIAFADEIIVVDSYSTDGTYRFLLNQPKVKVIQHPFKNYTAQKAFTLTQASNDWVLFVDADEIVSPALQAEIKETINSDSEHAAYWFRRKFMYKKQHLRFSGWQTDKNYRLFKKSKARFSNNRIVHETLEINGSSAILRNKLVHYCYRDFENYKGKMVTYGRMKAKEALLKGKGFNPFLLFAKPTFTFIYNYVVRFGILDGTKGIIICYLNALGDWERCLELRKLEQEQESPSLKTVSQRSS